MSRNSSKLSIAVLPLVNMSASEEHEYFSDGMTEEIINALAGIPDLRVTSRTSSFYFKGKELPVQAIGQELDVATVVEGSVRLGGATMRITIQLIDVSDDVHLWSGTFDRPADEVFKVQDEISLLVADKVREHLGHFEIGDQLVYRPAASLDAYQSHLRARHLMLKMTPGSITEALDILEEVLTDSPDFVEGNLSAHLAWLLRGTLGFMPAMEAFQQGAGFLQKAISIDPEHPECQLNLTYEAFIQRWDFDAAYQHLALVRERRPSVEYHQTMASILVAEGKFEAASNYIGRALEMDPFSDITNHLHGYIAFCRRDLEQAMQSFRRSLELKPGSNVSLLYVVQTLILQNKPEQALQFLQAQTEVDELTRKGGAALAKAAMGQNVSGAISELKKSLESEEGERATSLLLLLYALVDETNLGLELMQQALKLHLPLLAYAAVEPLYDPYRSDPRFREIIDSILGPGWSMDESNAAAPKKSSGTVTLSAELESAKERLRALMQESRPYLESGLNLRDLAAQLEMHPNSLSQLLNDGFQQNFSDFVNSYRLEQFKVSAGDPKLSHLTLLALALESGFNSKTVFNTFFKKKLGTTPKVWLKEVRQQGSDSPE